MLRQRRAHLAQQVRALRQLEAVIPIDQPIRFRSRSAGDFLQAHDVGVGAGEVGQEGLGDPPAPGIQRQNRMQSSAGGC